MTETQELQELGPEKMFIRECYALGANALEFSMSSTKRFNNFVDKYFTPEMPAKDRKAVREMLTSARNAYINSIIKLEQELQGEVSDEKAVEEA
jgi:predicted ribosome quality control (RQC) complex YloA/Tae2 family protein